MEKLYTTGEIFREKLLKNHLGEPYAHKGTVANIVRKLNPVTKKTPWGPALCLTKKQIDDYNLDRITEGTGEDLVNNLNKNSVK